MPRPSGDRQRGEVGVGKVDGWDITKPRQGLCDYSSLQERQKGLVDQFQEALPDVSPRPAVEGGEDIDDVCNDDGAHDEPHLLGLGGCGDLFGSVGQVHRIVGDQTDQYVRISLDLGRATPRHA